MPVRDKKPKRQDNVLTGLQAIVAEMIAELDQQAALQKAVERAAELVGADIVTIHVYDPLTNRVRAAAEHGVRYKKVFHQHEPGRGKAALRVVNKGEPMIAEDVSASEFKGPFSTRERVKSAAGFPLKVGTDVIGVLFVNYRKTHKFEQEEIEILLSFGNLAAVAIANANLIEQERQRANAMDLLQQVSAKISAALDERETLALIIEGAMRLTGTESGVIHLVDEAKQAVIRSYEVPEDFGHLPPRLSQKAGMTWTAITTGQTIAVSDITKDKRVNPAMVEKGVRAIIGTPLKVEEETIGILFLNDSEPHEFTEYEKELLSTLASQAAIAIENARLLQELDERATQLTRLQAITSGLRLREDKEDEILKRIHDHASRLMDTGNMYIALYDEATDTVRFGLAFVDGKRIDVKKAKGWQPRKAGKGSTEHIIRTREPLFFATKAEAKEWYAQPGRERRFTGPIWPSWLGVPMMVGDKVLGVIATYHPTREYVYSEDDLAILQTMANQAAIALDNARLLRDVNRRLEAVIEFSRKVAPGVRLREDEILKRIHDHASRLMDTDNMYIALYDEATDAVRFGLAFMEGKRVDVETVEGWQPRRADRGPTEKIIRTKKPIFRATKAEAEAWYAQSERREYIGEPSASWLGVPIRVGEKVLGVIAAYHPTREYVYSGDDLAILQTIASQAAIALDNARLLRDVNRRLEALAEFGQIALYDEAAAIALEKAVLHGSGTRAKIAEAYAIARIKDHQPEQPFYVGKIYVLQTGVQSRIPEGFEGVAISLPDREEIIQFEIVVHATDMEIQPAWRQSYVYSRGQELPLLEFALKPTRPGRKHIRVEFYYQRHWLAQVQFEVEVLEVSELVQA